MAELLDCNVTRGKLEGLSGKATDLPAKLGCNEFLGLASRFDVPSDSGEIVERGAIACDEPILIMHEHLLPVGIGRLIETAEGIVVHGRICNATQRGFLLLQALYGAVQRGLNPPPVSQLCLSATRDQKTERIIGGRKVVVTLEGRAREVSICLHGGSPDCAITRMGLPNLFQPTEWDQAFFAGLRHLFGKSAEYAGLYARIREREYNDFLEANPQNGETYESWITSLSF